MLGSLQAGSAHEPRTSIALRREDPAPHKGQKAQARSGRGAPSVPCEAVIVGGKSPIRTCELSSYPGREAGWPVAASLPQFFRLSLFS